MDTFAHPYATQVDPGTIAAARLAVVEEAKSWIGTKFHSGAKLKGIGVDCAQLLIACYSKVGISITRDYGSYSLAWHLHTKEEKLLNYVLEYADEVEDRSPGNVALWKVGHSFSHSAIVVKWPIIIHAFHGGIVQFEDVSTTPGLQFVSERVPDQGKARPLKFFRPKAWCEEAI